jgi:transposase-like protein
MLKVVSPDSISHQHVTSHLDEIARLGARRMLVEALEVEVDEYIARHKAAVDEAGRRLVVRNGRGKPRSVTLGAGTVELPAPRVDDRRPGEKFTSMLLPPYMRKSPKVESLLPLLYLKGLSTNAFQGALKEFLGEGTMGLSPASIVKLKKSWEDEFAIWEKRAITKRYAYCFADGVNVAVRLGEDKKLCLLVLIAVTEDGEKELLAVHPGYRESKDSWSFVLNSLIARGLKPPLVCVGDGALGFWAALRAAPGFEKCEEQRCWVHKIANVLDKLPKRLQGDAKELLHEMMRSESLASCEKIRDEFAKLYQDKYPKAVHCLKKDWAELTTFFHYPAAHWIHLRTTNPIESSFAAVKLRTYSTRGAGSATTAATMAFKLLCECEKRWRKINVPEELKNLFAGIVYKDGVVVPTLSTHQEAAAG